MPILNYKPTSEPTIPTQPIRVEPKGYNSIIYDDKETPIKSLLTFVSGGSWTVDEYFHQIVTSHNDLREVDPNEPTPYQQYERIFNFEIRVETPLKESQDTQTGLMMVTGAANVYGGFIPNKEDYFTAKAGSSVTAIFKVTRVERKSFNYNAVFAIEYMLIDYSTADTGKQTLESLRQKTQRDYYFNKDRIIDGQHPMLKSEDHQQIINLKSLYRTIVKEYFDNFYSKRHGLLILPGQDVSIYDPYLSNYIFKIVDSTDLQRFPYISTLTNESQFCMEQPQFWTILEQQDPSLINNCNQEMGLLDKMYFNTNNYLKGLVFSDIDYVVFPKTWDETTLTGVDPTIPSQLDGVSIKDTKNRAGVLSGLIDYRYTTVNASYLLYHPILSDTKYVLSNNFYSQSSSMSVIEILVSDYIHNRTIDNNMLIELSNKYRSFSRLEQFYFGPIVLTLLLYSINRTWT